MGTVSIIDKDGSEPANVITRSSDGKRALAVDASVSISGGTIYYSTVAYNENVAVPQNLETTLLSFTNATTVKYLSKIKVEGTDEGEIKVYKNTALFEKARITAANCETSLYYPNGGLRIEIGDILDVKVIQYKGGTRQFSAMMFLQRS